MSSTESTKTWERKRLDLGAIKPRVVSASLTIASRPVEAGSSRYQFRIRNEGASAILELRLNLYEALSPSDFGLDDTHMPKELASEAAVAIDCLPPATEVAILRDRWGPMSKYRGPQSKKLFAHFLVAGEASNDQSKTVLFTVGA